MTLTMSRAGTPSVMQTMSLMPASAASMMASAAHGGGHEDAPRCSAPVCGHGLAHRVEDRHLVDERLAALARA